MGQWWPAAGLGALSAAVRAWDLLKEVAIIFITSTTVSPQVNSRKGTQPHPSTENWIKDLLSMAPPIRTRLSFPYSQSLPSGSFQKPLILVPQRAAATAKSLQWCPTLCDPIDGSPPGSAVPGILQAKHWSGLPFPSPMHESESEVTQSCLTLLQSHGLQPTRLLHPRDFPGKSTGVGCHCLLLPQKADRMKTTITEN